MHCLMIVWNGSVFDLSISKKSIYKNASKNTHQFEKPIGYGFNANTLECHETIKYKQQRKDNNTSCTVHIIAWYAAFQPHKWYGFADNDWCPYRFGLFKTHLRLSTMNNLVKNCIFNELIK